MLIKTINSNLFRRHQVITRGVFFFLGLLVVNIVIFLINSDSSETLLHTKKRLTETRNHLKKIDTFSHRARYNREIYQKFQDQEIEKSHSIDELIDYIQSLQPQLSIPFLNVTIQKKQLKNGMRHINLLIELNTLTDLTFFQFIKKIETELPAVVRINSFSFAKEEKLTSHFFKKFAKNPRNAHLCQGTIDASITLSAS